MDKKPLDELWRFRLQGPWLDNADIVDGLVPSNLVQLGRSIRHTFKGKPIRCRTAVFISLALQGEWEACSVVFDEMPGLVASDIRTAHLGGLVLGLSRRYEDSPTFAPILDPPNFAANLLQLIVDSNTPGTDGMRLQAIVSLILSYLEACIAQLQLPARYTIETYLKLLYELMPRTYRRTPIMAATIQALAYGALAVFMSDKYQTKIWKNSGWDFALEATSAPIGYHVRASAIHGVGSSLSVEVRIDSSPNSQTSRDEEEMIRKVVCGVARKFELRVLREAEEGRLLDNQGLRTGLLGHQQAELDSYIRTAVMVFNIIVTETKVPLSIEVADKSPQYTLQSGTTSPTLDAAPPSIVNPTPIIEVSCKRVTVPRDWILTSNQGPP